MNIHLPQNLEATAEMLVLSTVPDMVVSPQANKPVIGIIQDALCGIRKFTMRDNFLTESTVHNLLMKLPFWDGRVPTPAVFKPKRLWTGKQLLSLVLPKTLNYLGYHSTHPDDEEGHLSVGDTRVIIENGELLSGIICKKAVGTSGGSLVHLVWLDYGSAAARDFLDGAQYIVNEWLLQHGFSVGLGDCVTNAATQERIDGIVKEAYTKVQGLLTAARDSVGGSSHKGLVESAIGLALTAARESSGKMASKNLPRDNNFKQMVEAGSKGSLVNISQIAAVVGQQNVEGGRIPFGMKNRALPFFAQGDIGPDAKGFVKTSYLTGLSPTEFFFHAMGGREGLIDTAVKTSETGYLQRKLVKALEDVSVAYDDTVRTAAGIILQFRYGEDGMDAVAIERQNVTLITMNDEQVESLSDIPEERAQLFSDRAYLRRVFSHLEASVHAPVHFRRLLKRITEEERVVGSGMACSPEHVYVRVSEFIRQIPKSFPIFEILVRFFLASGSITKEYNFSEEALEKVLTEVYRKFVTKAIAPGEAVGVIAAQSIGEPTTQLTLNSVEYNTEILLLIDGKLARYKIGDYIDAVIKNAPKEAIENHPNNTTLVHMMDQDVKILSNDENGRLFWKRIEAVTQHPVINKDGSDTLLKVTLRSGRVITATKAKSFLTRQPGNQILAVEGENLKVGHFLPVTRALQFPTTVTKLDLGEFLSPKEWLYENNIKNALQLRAQQPGKWPWFAQICDTVPFSRGDSLLESDRSNGHLRKDDCVYPKFFSKGKSVSHIPAKIPLDELFGWFCGAYLAEGCCTKHAVLISNLDQDFNFKVIQFCQRWNLGFHFDEGPRPKGYTRTIRIHSMVLAQLFLKLFGTGAKNKRIYPELFKGPSVFRKAILTGYIDGDGSICKKTNCVRATSISQGLLVDMQLILSTFGIRSKIIPLSARSLATVRISQPKASQSYTLYLPCESSLKLARLITLTIGSKRDRLSKILNRKSTGNDEKNWIPNVTFSNGKVQDLTENQVSQMIQDPNVSIQDKHVLESCLQEDLWYDPIVSIEQVRSERPFVYDFTVEDTRNFSDYQGVALRDTFHSAGIANTLVTTGVGRLKELINDNKNFSTPSMTISLVPSLASSKRAANLLAKALRHVKLEHVIESFSVHHDPLVNMCVIEQDRAFVDAYWALPGTYCAMARIAPWMARLVLKRSILFDLDLTVQDICDVIESSLEHDIVAYGSDDNAQELVVHLRMEKSDESSDSTGEPAQEGTSDAQGPPGTTVTESFMPGNHFWHEIMRPLLDAITVNGIPEIERISVQERKLNCIDTNGGISREKRTEYYLETLGINMHAVMTTWGVDRDRLYCNDPKEMLSSFGIEAARQCLLTEISKVISSDGSYVNYRHIALLCELMVNRGQLMSVTRHGVNRLANGPIKKSTFEETLEVLMDAALNCEVDYLQGVSENIMMGRPIPSGTGAISVLYDDR